MLRRELSERSFLSAVWAVSNKQRTKTRHTYLSAIGSDTNQTVKFGCGYVCGPTDRVCALEEAFPDVPSCPFFQVVVLHEQVDPTADCLVELVESVSSEEEDTFAILQSPQENSHQTIAYHILPDSLLKVYIGLVQKKYCIPKIRDSRSSRKSAWTPSSLAEIFEISTGMLKLEGIAYGIERSTELFSHCRGVLVKWMSAVFSGWKVAPLATFHASTFGITSACSRRTFAPALGPVTHAVKSSTKKKRLQRRSRTKPLGKQNKYSVARKQSYH